MLFPERAVADAVFRGSTVETIHASSTALLLSGGCVPALAACVEPALPCFARVGPVVVACAPGDLVNLHGFRFGSVGGFKGSSGWRVRLWLSGESTLAQACPESGPRRHA